MYPIFLFTEEGDFWRLEGNFVVSEIEERFVVLKRGTSSGTEANAAPQDESTFNEGNRRYVTHLLVERSSEVVQMLKHISSWVCDICQLNFEKRYGVQYIEAHHKIPITTYSEEHEVCLSDFALLCPNCHKAVHVYMKTQTLEYDQIKTLISAQQSHSH